MFLIKEWIVLRKAILMSKSFYHFLMTYRHPSPKDTISAFANHAYRDHSFPKMSQDYNQISSYLELNGQYLQSMSIFDDAWELYMLNEQKEEHRDHRLY